MRLVTLATATIVAGLLSYATPGMGPGFGPATAPGDGLQPATIALMQQTK